ncbi:MAG TPA: ABC transporter ATP-binding protein [Nitrososphaerales archaeon]|nr:ABC transporter ATP-binding protein [Nitrososphaerales archaeon]
MEPGLELDGISKSYSSKVLDDVSFSLEKGTVGTLVGPSGAGKTTTLNIISGLILADKGTVSIGGRLVERAGEHPFHVKPIQRGVGYVFQDHVLFPHMSVFDNVAFGLRARHVSEDRVKAQVAGMLGTVGIEGLRDRKPGQLSGGQMQRVAVARALILEPDLLLLDEPLSALDPQTREAVRSEMRILFESVGTTVVYVTHDLDEAFFLGQRIGILLSGRLASFGTKKDLLVGMNRAAAEFLGFNLMKVEPRGERGDKRLFYIPAWDREVALSVIGSAPIRIGRPAVLAIPPESVEIHRPGRGGDGKDLTIQRISELKDSVLVVLKNSGDRLVGRVPYAQFQITGLSTNQVAHVSFASGFLLTDLG